MLSGAARETHESMRTLLSQGRTARQ